MPGGGGPLIYAALVRIITFNANGIRSAQRKGLFAWLARSRADVICIQETKAQVADLGAEHQLEGYHAYFHDAVKPGYAGTALYSKREPDEVVRGFGVAEFDAEGRYLE